MEDVKTKELTNDELIEMYKLITDFINKLEGELEKVSNGESND